MAKIKSGFKGERAIVLPSAVVDSIAQDVLGKELHITDIGYYPQASYHYRERTKEEAEQFILIYCVEGHGWFSINGINTRYNRTNFLSYLKIQHIHTEATLKTHGLFIGYISTEKKHHSLQTDLTNRQTSLPTPTLVLKSVSVFSKKYFIH